MEKIFGRATLIAMMWKLLEEQSILFTAERRIGKTTVLTELYNNQREGFIVIFSDLEKVDTPLEFVNDILNKAAPFIKITDKSKNWFLDLWGSLGGIEIGGVIKIPEQRKKDWKEILMTTISVICANTDGKVVFLWDEIPYMLQKINAHETAKGLFDKNSLRILDSLRALRQEHKNLRMIYTGSIGLHHVLENLTDDTYTSAPTNDMEEVSLNSIKEDAALKMAKYRLVKDADITNPENNVLNAIISQCDHIPFYIERLIRRLVITQDEITETKVDDEVLAILTDARDSWKLEHFRSRLDVYYKGEVSDVNDKSIPKAKLAKSLLNHIASENSSQSIDECFNALKNSYAINDRDIVIELLTGLVKDHYLLRGSDGKYEFSFNLIKRWWVLAEGLSMNLKGDKNA